MSTRRIFRGAALGLTCAALTLAGCSNTPGTDVNAVSAVKSIFTKRTAPRMPNSAELQAAIAQTLSATSAPLIAVALKTRKVATVMQQIETNGPYETYGSPDRRSLTLRGELLTATRGLGNDILSADVEAVRPLITGRINGQAKRVHRYLDGENLTVALDLTCITTVGRDVSAPIGGAATEVAETCTTLETTFTNTYLVSPGGRILQSRQWISPLNGYIQLQRLR